MEELRSEIVDFIDVCYDPLLKEYHFIEKNDWTTAKEMKRRAQEHGLAAMVTDRAITTAKDLYKIAIADLKHKEVKKVMSLCKKIFDMYEKRYHSYTESQDWEKFMDEGKDLYEVEEEMKFQNDIRNSLNGMKRVMREINFGEDTERIDIKTHNDQPIPFLMRGFIEKMYPEVKDKLDKRKEDKDVTTKTRKSKKRNNKVSGK